MIPRHSPISQLAQALQAGNAVKPQTSPASQPSGHFRDGLSSQWKGKGNNSIQTQNLLSAIRSKFDPQEPHEPVVADARAKLSLNV
jgi:hypothetical protein